MFRSNFFSSLSLSAFVLGGTSGLGCRCDVQEEPVPVSSAPTTTSSSPIVQERPGCGSSWRGPWNLKSDEVMKVRDRGGDPKLGSVLWIGQWHFMPGQNAQKDKGAFEYQMRIYRLLEKIRPEVIFKENEFFNLESNLLRHHGEFPQGYFDSFVPEYRTTYLYGLKTFRNGVPSSLSGTEREAMIIFGAAHLYLFSHDNVWLRRANTPKEEIEATQEFLWLAQQGRNQMSDPDFERLQRRRERYLAREVTFYMKRPTRPCNTVVIYGDGHLQGSRIEDAFDSYQFRPHIQSVIFPGALDY